MANLMQDGWTVTAVLMNGNDAATLKISSLTKIVCAPRLDKIKAISRALPALREQVPGCALGIVARRYRKDDVGDRV